MNCPRCAALLPDDALECAQCGISAIAAGAVYRSKKRVEPEPELQEA